MKLATRIVLVLITLDTLSAVAATRAEQRMHAARELEDIFGRSQISGFELKFTVRGERCDALQVQGYTNLYEEMMRALGNGTVIYGQILPGGVNDFAFKRGFRRVIYTNSGNETYVSVGEPRLTRPKVKQMRRCTDVIAAKLTADEPKPVTRVVSRFEPLSWSTARVGTKLYDGAYKHEASIVAIRRSEGIIEVRYTKSGSVEPKLLEAVARFWYVRK